MTGGFQYISDVDSDTSLACLSEGPAGGTKKPIKKELPLRWQKEPRKDPFVQDVNDFQTTDKVRGGRGVCFYCSKCLPSSA